MEMRETTQISLLTNHSPRFKPGAMEMRETTAKPFQRFKKQELKN